MNFLPLINAPLAIQFHVLTVIPAAFLGLYILWRRKGTPVHRLLGKIWIALMVLTSLSTFFIHQIKLFFGFSPIHFLSIFVIVNAVMAIRAVRQRRIMDHKRHVLGMYIGGIVIAGLFTLLPGRIMNEVAFGGFDFGNYADLRFIGWVCAVSAGIGYFVLTAIRARKLPGQR